MTSAEQIAREHMDSLRGQREKLLEDLNFVLYEIMDEHDQYHELPMVICDHYICRLAFDGMESW